MARPVVRRTDDLAELTVASIKANTRALHDGEAKYPPDAWRKVDIIENLRRLRAHLDAYERNPDSLTDLTHLHCRSSILVARALPRLLDNRRAAKPPVRKWGR